MPDKNLLYYLDTNICISFLRNKNKILRDKFLSYPQENIKIPAIVAAELMHGAYKSKENDLFIASLVLSLNEILVTNNVREFSRVEGLIIEDWTT